MTLQNVIDEWIELRKKSFREATVIQNTKILKNITNYLDSVAIKDINLIGEKFKSDISTIFIFRLMELNPDLGTKESDEFEILVKPI